MIATIEEFRAELARALAHAGELARGGRPSMRRILAELEDLEARTRAASPPHELRDGIAFDVIAVRELEGVEDGYCEQLSRLAAFVRNWPA